MCRMNQEKLLHKIIQLKRQLSLVENALMNIETESDLYRECVQSGLSFETTEQLRIAGSDRGKKCNYE